MDARDRLRRYIEQRRELGESEFVLDSLPVDDVLRMLGAPGAGKGASPAEPSRVAKSRTAPDAAERTADVAPDVALNAASDVATNTAPDAAADVVSGVAPSALPDASPPPVPEVRFDPSVNTDWRSALSTRGRDSAPAQREVANAASTVTPLPAWLSALDIPAGLTVGSAQDALFRGPIGELASLDAVANAIRECRACPLFSTAINPVPGEGNPDADFVCVGEAPGASEDESGRPFVGAAGQLLTKILAAIHFARDDVFICNVLKHRPPGNRNPLPDEVHACSPYLVRQIELLRPRVILALGTFAAQTLLETTQGIGKLRGQLHRYHGIPLVVTYHPAALLRNEAWKRPTWEDVKLARRILDASRAAHPSA